jgi:hypothetical protein
MLSSRLIIRSLAARSFWLWVVTRAAASFVLALGGSNPLTLSMLTIVAIIGLSAGLALLEVRRHGEQRILASAAKSPFFLYALLLIPSAIGELVLMTIGWLVANSTS